MNTQGMERFEGQVADYINTTDNHVLYRVTPMFEGDDLLAKGVLIEAKSVEDKGEKVQFNVFCYNVQPDIIIDYKTGDSKKVEKEEEKKAENTENTENTDAIKDAATTAGVIGATKAATENKQETTQTKETSKSTTTSSSNNDSDKTEYVLNTSTKKFHYSWCSSIRTMKAKNKQTFTGTRSQVINKGYQPCKKCNP
jgi:DNA-entry nuclease